MCIIPDFAAASAWCIRLARQLDYARTRICAEAERLFLAELGGGCAKMT